MAKEETKTAETKTAQPANQADASEVDPNALSIGDLKNLTTIIDVASSRGAFRANEMASIGLMYNKLQGFLSRVAPANPAAAQQPITGAAPTTAPTSSIGGK